jgi:O-methyltransferase
MAAAVIARAYRSGLRLAATPLVVSRVVAADAARPTPAGAARVWRMAFTAWRNSRRVPTASSFLEHLLMAAALLDVPAQEPGVVVECGCFKGGSTVNLSLACALAGRELHVYDSFAGLPDPTAADAVHRLEERGEIHTYEAGMYSGSLEEVRGNVARFGDLSVTRFHPGYFEDTMPGLDTPVAMAFVDVDLVASLEPCVRAIWPMMPEGGTLFVHEAEHADMAGFFHDADWWGRELGTHAPGLAGSGTGVGLEPVDGRWGSSLGYARKPNTSRRLPAVPG